MINQIFQYAIALFKRKEPSQFVKLTSHVDYSQTYNIDGDFKDDFYLNLQKTIAWTENIISRIEDKSIINYSKVLRTTNPIYEGKPFYTFSNSFQNIASTPDVGFNYSIILTDALSARKDTALPAKDLKQSGKILKFEIDLTTYDGAPCAESGFVDESDIPPIDTWFYITKKYLYCWIPSMFIGKMQDAIDVEILGSYNWLEEINPELNQKIFDTLRQNCD